MLACIILFSIFFQGQVMTSYRPRPIMHWTHKIEKDRDHLVCCPAPLSLLVLNVFFCVWVPWAHLRWGTRNAHYYYYRYSYCVSYRCLNKKLALLQLKFKIVSYFTGEKSLFHVISWLFHFSTSNFVKMEFYDSK